MTANDEAKVSIEVDTLDSPEIAALLQAHLDFAMAQSPPESVHALDLEKLRASDTTFWSAWLGDKLVGCIALKAMGGGKGEIKSMHTAKAARGKGVARQLLRHLISEARRRGLDRLYLETGSMKAFLPARRLYDDAGFEQCGPFGSYEEDPHSVFMTLDLKSSVTDD